MKGKVFMEGTIAQFLSKHHIQFTGQTFLVGVSGGPDSLALLHLFSNFAKFDHLNVAAIVVDHQLREESKDDVMYVKEICKDWDIPITSVQVDVGTYAKSNKKSIQVAARELRYEAYEETMEAIKADYLVLGHHGDDQVETLVMNVARAANSSSLLGIPFQRPFGRGTIIRPLLSVSKVDIYDYCSRHHLHPRIDASNEDTSYTRNNIRKNVIPLLKERNNLLHLTGQYLNETLIEDEQYLNILAKNVFDKVVTIDEPLNRVYIDIVKLIIYEKPLQRRVFRLTLDYLYQTNLPKSLSYKHEESFLIMLESQHNKRVYFPRNLMLEKSYDQIHFYFYHHKKTAHFRQEINQIPTTVLLPNGDQLEVSIVEEFPASANNSFVYATDEVVFPFIIRQREIGDRMSYKGLHGTKKLKDILIDEKIPRHQREQTYVLTDYQNEILWLIGMRKIDTPFKTSEKRSYLLFTYIHQAKTRGEPNA